LYNVLLLTGASCRNVGDLQFYYKLLAAIYMNHLASPLVVGVSFNMNMIGLNCMLATVDSELWEEDMRESHMGFAFA
jgi:hypothetical protein